MTNWVDWHRHYDDPTSSLARRLAVVRLRLGEVLDASTVTGCRLLSLCAGEGRDVVPVLAGRRPGCVAGALLVERDQVLAQRAKDAVAAADLKAVEVRCADAGDPAAFADFLPVDVLMLCGIFGHLDDADIKNVIASLPDLVRGGGSVIWTRGGSQPDMRPVIRKWFRDAGLAELSFDGDPEEFGVGANVLALGTPWHKGPAAHQRLFTFRG